jgi:hypothetical protein
MTKKIVFGSTALINNFYWNDALKRAGFSSKTIMFNSKTHITKDIKWDITVSLNKSENEYLNFFLQIPNGLKAIYMFFKCITKFDIFILSFDGFLIGKIPVVWRWQSFLFKILKKKVVLIPYGGDFYVYKDILSEEMRQGLQSSYPMSNKKQKRIAQRVDYWKKHADMVIPGFAYADIYRPDELKTCRNIFLDTPSPLIIDEESWFSERPPLTQGQVVEIAHMPNHRGFKGTDKILEVIQELISEGFNIKFHLIEKLPNEEVKLLLKTKIHILIDQIYFIGYALNSIEGMMSSCVVMANISDNRYTSLYVSTYLDECPIININKSNLKHELISIIQDHPRINELSKLSRDYVEKFHSYRYFAIIFEDILLSLYQT